MGNMGNKETIPKSKSFEDVRRSSVPDLGEEKKAPEKEKEKVMNAYDQVCKKYTIRQIMSRGSFSTVWDGWNVVENKRVAVKHIVKAKVTNITRLKGEIEILQKLHHPNVIRLYEAIEDERELFLIMEHCNGGELFDRIASLGHFSERDAALLVEQLFSALEHSHENEICHRDLKPENLLFLDKDGSVLKLIDFGLASRFGMDDGMKTCVGTPYYGIESRKCRLTCFAVAPEVFGGKYDNKCDIWSAGIITYVLLCGCPPFLGASPVEIIQKVVKEPITFKGEEWKTVSKAAIDFVCTLLQRNPTLRPTAKQALQHPWIVTHVAGVVGPNSIGTKTLSRLKRFSKYSRIKRKALDIVAESVLGINKREFERPRSDTLPAPAEPPAPSAVEGSPAWLSRVWSNFGQLDLERNGRISLGELQKSLNISEKAARKLMDRIDVNQTGAIEQDEFLAAMLKPDMLKEDELWSAFKRFDVTNDGYITTRDLKLFFPDCTDEEIAGMIAEADITHDGKCSFEEFKTLMTCTTPPPAQVSTTPTAETP